MDEPRSSHPYRPENAPASPTAGMPRHVPSVVRIHVLWGGATSRLLLALIFASPFAWIARYVTLGDSGSQAVTLFTGGLTAWLVAMIVRELVRRSRSLRLLERGCVTYGTLIEKRALPVRGDDPQRYFMRFSFEEQGRTHVLEMQTTAPEPLEDDRREQILYLPEDIQGAVLVDKLPGQPRVLSDNTVSADGHSPGAVSGLMLLATAILVNLVGLYLWLR